MSECKTWRKWNARFLYIYGMEWMDGWFVYIMYICICICIHIYVYTHYIVHLIQSRERDANACACVYPISPENIIHRVPSASVRLLWILHDIMYFYCWWWCCWYCCWHFLCSCSLFSPVSVTLQRFFFRRVRTKFIPSTYTRSVCIEISCSPDENFQ